MIRTHEMPDGFILDTEPFGKENKNARCKIISEIKSLRNRCDVRFSLANLDHVMTLTDVAILMNAMRALTVRTQEIADTVRHETKTQKRRRTARKK